MQRSISVCCRTGSRRSRSECRQAVSFHLLEESAELDNKCFAIVMFGVTIAKEKLDDYLTDR